ncbi:4-fold beta flower protein [Clostridium sp. FP1]|uniref:4-fold beta flower protein n=1 Tax=Clostridium sp. FP1 TaxID=2724076 RepID=UPI0013E91DED|nr:hypothetical protein [Clostridium sp. FP1]MBZ9633603.1 hypothetical protein [Clostridium sp. FP1]
MPIIMEPLYDKRANFVGWLLEYSNVFDKHLKWVAYVYNNYVWATKSRIWIGGLRGTNLLDRDGRIVAWSTSGPVVGGIGFTKAPLDIGPQIIPVEPIIPGLPLNPGYAPEPAGEWSKLTFTQWINQR